MKDFEYGKGIIRVQATDFKGKQYLDIRRYYQTKEGEYKPTLKGISIPIELACKIATAISELCKLR